MPFPDIDPILVQIGPFAIRWYALAYVAGILLGWRYATGLLRNTALWTRRPAPMTPEQLDDLILWIAIGVIGGGRLGHVLFYTPFERTLSDPFSILRVWEGGMSFHGGVIGVTIAMVVFAWRNRLDLLRIADVVAPAYPIGHFLGRCANFINGELWGRPTDAPWGVVFCNDRLREAGGGVCLAGEVPRHPSQLYEAFFEGLVLFLILRWATHGLKLGNRRGVITGIFVLFYGIFRIAIETVRQPDAGLENLPLGLTMGMILSIPMLLLGAFLIWRGMREPLPPHLPDPQPAAAKGARAVDKPA